MRLFTIQLCLLFSLLSIKLQAQPPEVDSIIQLIEQHQTRDTLRVNLLNRASNMLFEVDVERALKYAKEADKIAAEEGFIKGQAWSNNLIGICYDEKSDYKQALKYYKKALQLYQKQKNKGGVAQCYINIGIVYLYQGNHPEALKNYQKSLKINREIGNEEMTSFCYTNIGIIHLYQEEYDKALDYFQKSLEIDEKYGNRNSIAGTLTNIGIIYEKQNNLDKAIEYSIMSLKIKEELGSKSGIAINNLNIGSYYTKKKAYAEANQYLQKALTLSSEIGHKNVQTYCYQELANLYLIQGNAAEAYKYSKKGYLLAKEIGNVEQLKLNSETLAKSAIKLGNYKEAYDYHLVFKEMSDSLFNEENIKELAKLESQFKYEEEKRAAALVQKQKDALRIEREERQELLLTSLIIGFVLVSLVLLFVVLLLVQKQRANTLLASQKDEIDIKNANLKDLNATKDKFFSIISHDLKSPFNAILGFSSMLLAKHNSFNRSEREEAIKYMNTSAESAFKLLENLLTWSKSQSGKMEYSPKRLNLSHSVSETIGNLQGQADEKGITIINNVLDNINLFADENMLSMVLRNLISNALKFTYKGGVVSIKAQRRIEDILVSVSDTGVGIPEETLSKLFNLSENISTKGTNDEKGTGLGLILCKEFVEQHSGNIWAESEIGKGTTFYFTIPTA